MKRFWSFLKGIISTGDDTSSKRFYGLWAMVLVTAIVTYALYKSDVSPSLLNMFYALLGLVTALAGVSSYEAATKHISNNKTKTKEE